MIRFLGHSYSLADNRCHCASRNPSGIVCSVCGTLSCPTCSTRIKPTWEPRRRSSLADSPSSAASISISITPRPRAAVIKNWTSSSQRAFQRGSLPATSLTLRPRRSRSSRGCRMGSCPCEGIERGGHIGRSKVIGNRSLAIVCLLFFCIVEILESSKYNDGWLHEHHTHDTDDDGAVQECFDATLMSLAHPCMASPDPPKTPRPKRYQKARAIDQRWLAGWD